MTVSNLWECFKEGLTFGNVIEAIESKIKKNSGRKTKWNSEEINSLLGVYFRQRGMLRNLEKATGIFIVTLYRDMKKVRSFDRRI